MGNQSTEKYLPFNTPVEVTERMKSAGEGLVFNHFNGKNIVTLNGREVDLGEIKPHLINKTLVKAPLKASDLI